MQKVLTRDGLVNNYRLQEARANASSALLRCISFQEKYHPHPFSMFWKSVSPISERICILTYEMNNEYVQFREAYEEHNDLCRLLIRYISILEINDEERRREFSLFGSLKDFDSDKNLPRYSVCEAKRKITTLFPDRRRF